MEKQFSLLISENMCLQCIFLPSSFQFFKISRCSNDQKCKGEQEVEGGGEVDGKWQVINGVGILKLSVFALL